MLDRTVSPKFYSPEFSPFPKPQKTRLLNGLPTFSYNNGDQDVFKLEIIISGGSSASSNPALPTLCVSMLREGSEANSAQEINRTLDYFGAFLDLKSGIDNTIITLYGRSVFLKELIPLLAEIIFAPVFEVEAIEKHKKKMTQNLLINQDKTSYWAPRLLRKSIFGDGHPYSTFLSVDGINAIVRGELIDYHNEHIKSGLKHIFFSGAFDEDVMTNLIQANFGSAAVSKDKSPKPSTNTERSRDVVKDLNGASQASMAIGMPCLKITDDKYPNYAFLTKVLGGYFGSRLMKKIREEEGLTYGIHAYNVHLNQGSYLQISSDIEINSVNKAIDFINEEVSVLRNEPIPLEEANTVKNYMIGEFVNDSNTVFDFSDLYKHIVMHDLSENYYQFFYDSILEIDPDKIQELAKLLLNTENFSIVKVL